MNAVRIEKATAKKAQLQSQIKALQEQMAANDANQAEATSVRNEEHAEYQKSSKDYRDSADAVAAAIETLSAYYNKGSFLQVAVKVGQAPELGGAKSDIAGTIMEMLEVAESDFTRLLAEAESAENSAVAAYDKLSQDNRVAKASNTQEVAGKKGEVKTVEAGLLNYKEDHATTGKELDAVLAYLDKLKPQCETKVMSYAERKARREEEIEGLREALEILQG
jgi:soluble cytochrome b562